MPQQPHKLVVTYWQGKMEAGCTCGRWEPAEFLCPGERPSQLRPILERAFARHVAEAGGQEVQRLREPERNSQRAWWPRAAPNRAALWGTPLWVALPVLAIVLFVLLRAPNTPLRGRLPIPPPVQKTAGPVR